MIHELVVNGLKTTQAFEEALREKVQSLLESAPSDATASAVLRKCEAGYEGLIQIFSSQGKFVAKSVSQNFNDLVQTLSKELHQQFKVWRGYRFLPEN